MESCNDGYDLHQLHPHLAPDRGGGSLHCIELNLVVLRVEQAIQMRATGSHAAGHLHFGDSLVAHRLFYLPSQNPLDGIVRCLLEDSLFAEKIVQRRADMGILAHDSTSLRIKCTSKDTSLQLR